MSYSLKLGAVVSGLSLSLLEACGGGAGGATADASTAPAEPSKTRINYRPYFVAAIAGTYAAECGPEKEVISFNVTPKGLVTPWIFSRGGNLDSPTLMLGLYRTRNMDGSFLGNSFSATLMEPGTPVLAFQIGTGDAGGEIGQTELTAGAPPVLTGKQCKFSKGATPIDLTSPYLAFASLMDSPKRNLNCSKGNVGSAETFEVSGGKLKFRDETISLIDGLRLEQVVKPVETAEVNQLIYTATTLDGATFTMAWDQYGEAQAFTFQKPLDAIMMCDLKR